MKTKVLFTDMKLPAFIGHDTFMASSIGKHISRQLDMVRIF